MEVPFAKWKWKWPSPFQHENPGLKYALTLSHLCPGQAVKSTGLKLWCFWSTKCTRVRVPVVARVPLSNTHNMGPGIFWRLFPPNFVTHPKSHFHLAWVDLVHHNLTTRDLNVVQCLHLFSWINKSYVNPVLSLSLPHYTVLSSYAFQACTAFNPTYFRK